VIWIWPNRLSQDATGALAEVSRLPAQQRQISDFCANMEVAPETAREGSRNAKSSELAAFTVSPA
jgi:hypothetical protein